MKLGHFFLVLLILISVYLVVIHFNNPLSLTLPVPFRTPFTVAAGFVVAGSFVLGLFYAWISLLPRLIWQNSQIRKLNKRLQELENQNSSSNPPTVTSVPYHSVE